MKNNSVIPREGEVGERNLHVGLIPRVIPLKLFLDMVPSSSADVTRSFRGCYRGIDVEE